MLHKYEKIEEAMAACTLLEYPLIVIVHDKLPTSLNNADEATRGGTTGATPAAAHGNTSTTPRFPFLSPSYSTALAATNGSFFGEVSSSFEGSLTSAQEDAIANASLGYLMRPTNSTSEAAKLVGQVQDVADDEEPMLVADFPLGKVRGGVAQREALLVALLESRLGSVTLLHLIDAGTPDYDAFSAAVPAPPHTTSAVLPRVHMFFPPSAAMPPIVLNGPLLTPQNLYNCVQMCLLKAKGPARSAIGPNSSTTAGSPHELQTFFASSVAAMNREYVRSRQVTHPILSTAASPQQPQDQHSDPSHRSSPGALAAAHLIMLAGLPTSFSTKSTAVPTHKTILTSSHMTLQTIWRTVEKHLEWAQREVQQAQATSTWNGAVPPKPRSKFFLSVEPPGLKDGVPAAVTATSSAEAAKILLQNFPSKTVVRVTFETAEPETSQQQSVAAASLQTAETSTATSHPSDVVCDGDVCRRRIPEDMKLSTDSEKSSSPSASFRTAQSTVTSASEVSAAVASAGTSTSIVTLHCLLPNGRKIDVAPLDPSVATLQSNVRPTVEEAVGSSNFVFVCAYPPKRYGTEEETRPLNMVGLSRSCALRIVLLNGAAFPNASRGETVPQWNGGGAPRAISNAASSLLSKLLGARRDLGGTPPTTAATRAPVLSQSRVPQQRTTYNSMAEMLAANEEAERETAMERLRQEQELEKRASSSSSQHEPNAEQRAQGKKSNRYFGGGSTEFLAEDTPESKTAAQLDLEGLSGDQRQTFLRDQLQRLMGGLRRQAVGEASGDPESGDGEPQSATGAHRAFHGQGRRLAERAPSTTGDETDPAPSHGPRPAVSHPNNTAESEAVPKTEKKT